MNFISISHQISIEANPENCFLFPFKLLQHCRNVILKTCASNAIMKKYIETLSEKQHGIEKNSEYHIGQTLDALSEKKYAHICRVCNSMCNSVSCMCRGLVSPLNLRHQLDLYSTKEYNDK